MSALTKKMCIRDSQMTVVLLRHRGSPEDIVLQLLLCVRHIDYQEGHQEHSLIPAVQITEDVLCFTCIGGNVGGDDVHIEPFPRRPLLSVDLHTVQIGDLALDSFDGFILIHASDMDADKNAAVRVKQIGKHPVIELSLIHIWRWGLPTDDTPWAYDTMEKSIRERMLHE